MKFVTVWGGNSKLRGGNFPPPKGPEKNTAHDRLITHDPPTIYNSLTIHDRLTVYNPLTTPLDLIKRWTI